MAALSGLALYGHQHFAGGIEDLEAGERDRAVEDVGDEKVILDMILAVIAKRDPAVADGRDDDGGRGDVHRCRRERQGKDGGSGGNGQGASEHDGSPHLWGRDAIPD